ncbi:hypothetical protein DY78_GL001757 [Lactiplantibacillus fabifermentans DSM 21115]|uniref:Uncharacterized protein n=1 Tax=Lactiplantibacillus fabifermentans DSM 21115 TaxID=1413187 RepID=A0A0R2NCX9_9LACO|nr:hypothetical protein DY78_GL001757 [Lactiplantibacillus fabifermentans DSM 21115]
MEVALVQLFFCRNYTTDIFGYSFSKLVNIYSELNIFYDAKHKRYPTCISVALLLLKNI